MAIKLCNQYSIRSWWVLAKNLSISLSTSTSCEHRWDLWWPWDGCAPGIQLTGICSGTSSSLGLLQFLSLGSSVLQSWLSSYMLFCEPPTDGQFWFDWRITFHMVSLNDVYDIIQCYFEVMPMVLSERNMSMSDVGSDSSVQISRSMWSCISLCIFV